MGTQSHPQQSGNPGRLIRPQFPGRPDPDRPQEPNERFSLIVITSPVPFDGEAALIGSLLHAGLHKLHIRKPAGGLPAIRKLIEQLPTHFHPRLVIHDKDSMGCLELATEYSIPQVHIPIVAAKVIGLAVSASVHSWEELQRLPPELEYAFISPVFDSISKPGYSGKKDLLIGPPGAKPCKAIGLGGINDRTILELFLHDWDGAALLGWIWERPDDSLNRYFKIMKMIQAYEE